MKVRSQTLVSAVSLVLNLV